MAESNESSLNGEKQEMAISIGLEKGETCQDKSGCQQRFDDFIEAKKQGVSNPLGKSRNLKSG